MTCLRQVTPAEFANSARAVGVNLPIEQTDAWDRFDTESGRRPWGKFLYFSEDGRLLALISLTKYRVRGIAYLWARTGPVWTENRPGVLEEQKLVKALLAYVHRQDKTVVFVRLHTWAPLDNSRPIIQFIAHNRTVTVDLSGTEEEIFANMRPGGRRNIRKALRQKDLYVREYQDINSHKFGELYAVLQETAVRGKFGIHPLNTYMRMLTALGSTHCRIFVAERGGVPLAWAMVTVSGSEGVYYYGASSPTGHKLYAADLLHWQIMRTLKAEGVRTYDFMGIASEMAPTLKGVTQFKRKFARDITEVAPPRDYPIYGRIFASMEQAHHFIQKMRRFFRAHF
ncbi:MAG: peptidoglycan bridge formation glycyltransferase FemA/FemB family protein [Actinomycetaceae bacterium]|nr:peptidoglycan bridge formation glycyltransferase FemA/FemB family protein [Actinomycetaceae bacterium]